MLSRFSGWFGRTLEKRQSKNRSDNRQRASDDVPSSRDPGFRDRVRSLISEGHDADALELLERDAPSGDAAFRRAWVNAFLADVYQDLGATEQARAAIERALADRPDDADLNYRAGIHALSAGDPELALDYFRLCRHYEPSHFLACSGEATALEKIGRPDAQRRAIAGYLDRFPESGAAAFELALLEHREGSFENCVALLRRINEKESIFPEAVNFLGLILGRDLGDIEAAISCFERVLVVRPGWTVALSNLGWMYSEAGQYEKGDELLGAVLDTIPLDPEARLIRAYINLKHARFESGWRYYGARHDSRFAIARPYTFPRWTGAPASDRSVLVIAEQGLGDHLMFCSCIPDVLERVGKLYVECHPKLVSLFRRSFPSAHIVENVPSGSKPEWLNSVGQIDLQIGMGDLPGIYRSNIDAFPHHHGYLRADPERIRFWKDRLAALGSGRKIGVSWRGGVRATRMQLRSFPPTVFKPLLSRGIKLVSLQYGEVEADLDLMRKSGVDIAHWHEALSDYDETAALVCALDCTVSVCTSVIHLCGALGRPAFVMVPRVAEWRYLYSGERLPWYPSLRLIRQDSVGDWGTVMEKVLANFHEMMNLHSSGEISAS